MRVRSVIAAGIAALWFAGPASASSSDLSLVGAVKDGNREGVRLLLSRHVDVNAREEDGTTALHWAVRANDQDVVAVLIRGGARAQVANRYGITPLSLAATNGSAAIIEALLKAGADPNSTLPEGETALMTAARTGQADAVKALLVHGADVRAREHVFGQTALMWAAGENHGEAAQALIDGGAEIDTTSTIFDPPTRWSLSNSYKGGFTALMFAARQGAMDAARVLIRAGADVNKTEPDGISPLLAATINGHYDMASMLVERGANVHLTDMAGVSPLYQTVDMHTLEFAANRPPPKWEDALDPVALVRVLLDYGADPNVALKRQRPPRKGDQIFGDSLMIEGATPFFLAAKRADLPIMRLLLEYGADPHAAPARPRTSALMAAAGVGWREGTSMASERDSLEAVKLLWDLGGVDINAASVARQTALHGAAFRGATSIIQFLADKGARLDLKDVNGRTALDETAGVLDGVGHPPRPEAQALLRRLMGSAATTAHNDTAESR
jgi:ankyrin repeat protein